MNIFPTLLKKTQSNIGNEFCDSLRQKTTAVLF